MLGNVWLGYNLSLIELYAHLSVTLWATVSTDKFINAIVPFGIKSFFFLPFKKRISLTRKVLVTVMTQT